MSDRSDVQIVVVDSERLALGIEFSKVFNDVHNAIAVRVAQSDDIAEFDRSHQCGIDVPGFATPSDAFDAIRLGARNLKLFPASTYGSDHLRALRAVLPIDVKVLAVGGIGAKDFAEWQAAGAAGFGIGSELYKAGDSAAVVADKIGAMRELLSGN